MVDKPAKPEEPFADLHVFSAIEAICESSIFQTRAARDAGRKIASICRNENGRAVREYDRRVAAAQGPRP